MKWSVFNPWTHILVTEVTFCSRIQTYLSSFRKVAGKRREAPSNTGLALWREAGYQEIGWKHVRLEIPTSHRSVIPTHNPHVLTCVEQTIVMMHDGYIRLYVLSIAYARDNGLERW